jgi:hypothetical protein
MTIFISYRRDDSADVTGRIYDRLVDNFGEDTIFKDVDSIPFGVNFRSYLNDIIGKSKILLVVIGPKWLNIENEQGKRRLDDPADFVRIEIEAALQRNIVIIPLLVSRSSMPNAMQLPATLEELAFYNGSQVRSDPDFHKDMDRLIYELEKHIIPDRTGKNQYSYSGMYPKASSKYKDLTDLSLIELLPLVKARILNFDLLHFLSTPLGRLLAGAMLLYVAHLVLWVFGAVSIGLDETRLPIYVGAISGIIAYPHKKLGLYILVGAILGVLTFLLIDWENITVGLALAAGLLYGVPFGAIVSRIQHIRKKI